MQSATCHMQSNMSKILDHLGLLVHGCVSDTIVSNMLLQGQKTNDSLEHLAQAVHDLEYALNVAHHYRCDELETHPH